MISLLDKTIAIGLIATVLLAGMMRGGVEPWMIAIVEILTALWLLLWAVKSSLERRMVLCAPGYLWPLIGLALVGLAQGLRMDAHSLSADVEATRLATSQLINYILLCLMGAVALQQRDRIRVLLNTLVIFGFALSLFGIIQHFTWNGNLYWIRPLDVPAASPFGPFANHSHFAGLMEMIAPLPLAMILAGAVRAQTRLLYGFMSVIMCLAIIISLSRGGMISLFAAIVFLGLVGLRQRSGALSQRRNAIAGAGVPGAVVMAILMGILWIGADPVINRVTQGSLTERPAEMPGEPGATVTPGQPWTGGETLSSSRGWIWRGTITMIRHNWLFGVGLGAFETVWPKYGEDDGTHVVNAAHNDYLQLLAETGVIGAALALWFILVVGWSVLRGLRARDPILAAAALGSGAGLTAMLVHSVFDFNLQVPSNAMMFLLLATVAARTANAPETLRETATHAAPAGKLRAQTRDMITGATSS